ncbi:MAG: glycine betaine transporter [Flavobacteriaceae bacterium]
MMVSLVLLYQFTPLQIEWVGLVVIGIYAACYYLVAQRRRLLISGEPISE